MSTFSPTFSADSTFDTTTVTNNVSSGVIVLNGVTTNTYTDPITATGEFLSIKINDVQKFVKIWN